VHTFYGTSDDGMRIYIDNTLLVNDWQPEPETTGLGKLLYLFFLVFIFILHSGTYTLVAGQSYQFAVEYFEDTGGAIAIVSWSSACLPEEVIPASQLTYTPFNIC
jgi:hypothetical protein